MAAGTTITLDQIALKRSSTPGSVPSTLLRGEPFIQLADKYMLVGDGVSDPVALPRIPLKTEVELVAGAVFVAALTAATNSAITTIRGGVASGGDTLAKVTTRLDTLGISGVSGLSAALAGKATPADISTAIAALTISSISGLNAALAGKATPADISAAIAALTINSISGLSSALAAKATPADISAAIATLTTGAPADLNTFAEVNDRFAALGIGNIAGLASALAAKATPADITAAVSVLTAGAPATLDTFAEVAARNTADEAALGALTAVVNGKVSTSALPDLLASLLGAVIVRPTGATASSSVADLFGRSVTFLDRGGVSLTAAELAAATVAATDTAPSFIDGRLFPSSAFSNTAVLNSYLDWCCNNKRTALFPPGDYLVRGKIIQRPCPIIAVGARFYLPNNDSSNRDGWVFQHEPDKIENIKVAEVQSWTGWTKGSRKLGELKNRKGQFIIPDIAPTKQYLSMRGSDLAKAYGFCDPFLVATNDGELFHALYANADVAQPQSRAQWIDYDGDASALSEASENTYFAKTLGDPIEINGLNLIIYEDGTSNAEKGALSIRRCRTKLKDCTITNKSNRPMPVLFNTSKSCFVDYENCVADGAIGAATGGTTNYGFQVGASASVTFTNCRAYHCRRGVDVQRGKNVHMQDCELQNGWGAHWGYWVGSDGGIISSTGIRGGSNLFAENPQAIQVAGGGFYCTNARGYVSERATAFFRVRTDTYQCTDYVHVAGNQITYDGDAAEFRVLDFRSLDEPREYGRPMELPRSLICENNPILVRRPDQVVTLLFWLRPRITTWHPSGVEINTRATIRNNPVNFEAGGPILVNGKPRIQIIVNKPSTKQQAGAIGSSTRGVGASGTGLRLVASDLPYLYLEIDAPAESADNLMRLDAQFERISGDLMVRRAGGAYREILAEAASIDDAQLTAPYDTAGRTGDAAVSSTYVAGDEFVGPIAKRGLSMSARNIRFRYADVLQFTVDTPTGGVNYPALIGSVSGSAVMFVPGGADTNIAARFYGKGTGAATLGRSGGKVGGFGSDGTTKPTITGSKGGNAALASLISAWAAMGFIDDGTT